MARFAFVLRFDGELTHFGAQHGLTAEAGWRLSARVPRPRIDETAVGRSLGRAVAVTCRTSKPTRPTAVHDVVRA